MGGSTENEPSVDLEKIALRSPQRRTALAILLDCLKRKQSIGERNIVEMSESLPGIFTIIGLLGAVAFLSKGADYMLGEVR
jgi:hypothetical protein